MTSITKKTKEKDKEKEKIAFLIRIFKFIEFTQTEVDRGVNPGGHYKAVWARDAAFILKDQFLSGYHKIALEQILVIWSNQIHSTPTTTEREISSSPSLLDFSLKRKPLLYGRGSPEMNFNPIVADENTKTKFDGALPTTIYHERNLSFCEVYAQNPDIDSTALMISTTSYILSNFLDLRDIYANKAIKFSFPISRNKNIDNEIKYKTQFLELSLNDIIDLLIPSMLKAVQYLQSRDIDNDGLLEQKHNEDWMDTTLRIGKVVYSQACWILALKNFSILLKKFGNQTESQRLEKMANRTILSVEEKMWSAKDGCYVDLLDADLHLDEKMHNRLVTQDVSLYLVALTEKDNNKDSDYEYINDRSMNEYSTNSENYTNNINLDIHQHALSTLEVLKKRAWKNNLPLVTETEITKTGPWLLETNEYHNHTCWPWITGIEMLARSRFGKIDDCNILLSKFVTREGVNPNMLHEWVHPLTFQGSGAYPFRTGISSIRITAMETIKMHPLSYK